MNRPDPTASASSDAATDALSFEQALAELEHLVAQMESGALSLEQSLQSYKRGAQLLQRCQGALKDAQQQVKILEGGMLQDFTANGE